MTALISPTQEGCSHPQGDQHCVCHQKCSQPQGEFEQDMQKGKPTLHKNEQLQGLLSGYWHYDIKLSCTVAPPRTLTPIKRLEACVLGC